MIGALKQLEAGRKAEDVAREVGVSTEENLRQLGCYVEQHGRPVSVYTDKASLFQMAPRAIHHRDAPIWVSCSSATRAFSGTGDVSA